MANHLEGKLCSNFVIFWVVFDKEYELPLWMVLLSQTEGKLESIDDVRSKFILHWERGIELISKLDDGSDWIHLISNLSNSV